MCPFIMKQMFRNGSKINFEVDFFIFTSKTHIIVYSINIHYNIINIKTCIPIKMGN